MVVLAQLAPKHGFQIKWALEFPGAPLGAIEYILAHVIKKLGDAGVKSATFGVGATGKFQVVENILTYCTSLGYRLSGALVD